MGRLAAHFDAKDCSNFAQNGFLDGCLLPRSNSDRTSRGSPSVCVGVEFSRTVAAASESRSTTPPIRNWAPQATLRFLVLRIRLRLKYECESDFLRRLGRCCSSHWKRAPQRVPVRRVCQMGGGRSPAVCLLRCPRLGFPPGLRLNAGLYRSTRAAPDTPGCRLSLRRDI